MSINYKESKYKNLVAFSIKKCARFFFRLMLAPLVRWRPRQGSEAGYSVVIACNIHLKELLYVILELMSRQDKTNLLELMIAFEVTDAKLDSAFRQDLLQRFPSLPITFITYTPLQSFVARTIDWPWLYSWMSWCLAIGRVRTRYLLIHDFDALPIRPDFLESRLTEIRQREVMFLGVNEYAFNGFKKGDGFTTTWELILDADEVRRRFRPIDIFNHVGRFQDRLVEYDTFIWAQAQARSTVILPVPVPDDLVHLGHVISQQTDFKRGRRRNGDNILFIPYMLFASGYPDLLRATTRELESATWPTIRYVGRRLDLSLLTAERLEWIIRLAEQAEVALVGEVRPEVRRFLNAIQAFFEQSAPAMARPR